MPLTVALLASLAARPSVLMVPVLLMTRLRCIEFDSAQGELGRLMTLAVNCGSKNPPPFDGTTLEWPFSDVGFRWFPFVNRLVGFLRGMGKVELFSPLLTPKSASCDWAVGVDGEWSSLQRFGG